MKRIALLSMLVLFSCKKTSPAEAEFQAAQQQANRENTIVFFQHQASGLCFAYMFEARGYGTTAVGGPALTNVPCEAVKHLIK